MWTSRLSPLALHHSKAVNMFGLDTDSGMNSHTLQHPESKPYLGFGGTGLPLNIVAFIPRICVLPTAETVP